MKKTVSMVTVIMVLVSLMCFSSFAYDSNKDHPIHLVTVSASASVSSDLSNATILVNTPEKDPYYYMGYELMGVENDGEKNIVTAKLKFHALNQYYFRIARASQIILYGVKYDSAAREEESYQLNIIVKFPADTEITPPAELPQKSFTEEKWEQKDGNWYYRLSDGQYAKKWKQIDGDWYYFYNDGRMAANEWLENAYYVGTDGKMLHDTVTPDGYRVGADGKWINETTSRQSAEASNSSSVSKSAGNGIYYWTENGKSYHTSPNCRTLKRSKKVYSGTSIPADKRDPCNVCVR